MEQSEFFDSSRIFMFNNLGIILLSVLVGVIVFKEKLSLLNYLGLFVSILGLMMLL